MAPVRSLLHTGYGLLMLAAPGLAFPYSSYETYSATTASYSEVSSPPPTVNTTNVTSHGPFDGPSPTTTGAISTSILASSIVPKPANKSELGYPADGKLHAPQPAPFTPAGGEGTNGSAPVYRVQSDFDYQSIALGLYQEWIELDLFHWGLSQFSEVDFQEAGLTSEDRYLLQFMAEQEVGHATALTNLLGGPDSAAPKQCTYNYPVKTLREYVDFSQKLTRFGESGVYGFLNHLDAREVGQILLQSITTEARQQMIFRQFEGLFPMPVWFEVGIPQSWAWTLLAPYISSCPANQTRLIWQNFPALNIINQPNPLFKNGSNVLFATTSNYTNTAASPKNESYACLNATEVGVNCSPAITRNRTSPLSYAGRQVFLAWDEPGKPIGPNNSYVTSTSAGPPKYALWVSQLNATYTELTSLDDIDIDLDGLDVPENNTAMTVQPDMATFAGDPAINGTIFLALTDKMLPVSPFNLSMVNPHVYALGLYQAG